MERREDIPKLLWADLQQGRPIDLIGPDACPEQEAVCAIVRQLYRILFHRGDLSSLTGRLQQLEVVLRAQLERVLPPEQASNAFTAFLTQIPSVRALIQTDLEAAYAGDPAATGFEEILCAYPGLYAIIVYRLAHQLYLLEVPLIPRMMTELAHGATGIDIHPGATIGAHFFIDHGTGVVIGQTTVIGNWVRLYQGVTLGGSSTRGGQQLRGKKRHPTIQDDVTIYAGASILGGDTVIGQGSVIGANTFVTTSIPDHTTVTAENTGLVLRRRKRPYPGI